MKNVNSKGCFIMLSRMMRLGLFYQIYQMSMLKILRRISRLECLYMEGEILPFTNACIKCKDFSFMDLMEKPCRVLSAEPVSGKVDVSLRKSTASKSQKLDDISYSDLLVGDIIDGQVKRVESYGLFVTIQSSELVCVVLFRLCKCLSSVICMLC